jgi:hypothetical protein
MDSQEKRRSSDVILAQVVTDVDQLKDEMRRNTEVTEQVRDILASFKIIAAVAKWLTAIAGAGAALIALVKTGGDVRFK